MDTVTLNNQIAELWNVRKTEPDRVISECSVLLANDVRDFTDSQRLTVEIAQAVAFATVNRMGEAVQAARSAEATYESLETRNPLFDFELRRILMRDAAMDNRQQEALQLALENLELMKDMPEAVELAIAHSDVATAYGGTGNYRDALKHLQESIKRTPDSELGHLGALLNNLGNVYLPMKREEEALACFTRARNAFRESGNRYREALAISNEGRALQAMERFDQSIARQQQALEIFRELGFGHDEVATYYKLGNTYAVAGDPKAAEEHFRRAEQRLKQGDASGYEVELRKAYADFLTDQGRYRDAVPQYERLLKLIRVNSTPQQIWRTLVVYAGSLERIGETAAALAAYKEVLAIRDAVDLQTGRSSGEEALPELEPSVDRDLALLQATSQALVEANKLLAEQSQELTKLAETDELTRIYNRRYFTEALDTAIADAKSTGRKYSVMFLDVDYFKNINDTYGHDVGDIVLRELATVLQSVVPQSSVVARWGGEEFAIILTDSCSDNAREAAEKVRVGIAAYNWAAIADDLSVTMSGGIVSSGDNPVHSATDLMHLADELLYTAKEGGRNQMLGIKDLKIAPLNREE